MVHANSGVGQLEGGLIRATRAGYLEDASSRALSQGGFLDEAFFERLLGPHERKNVDAGSEIKSCAYCDIMSWIMRFGRADSTG